MRNTPNGQRIERALAEAEQLLLDGCSIRKAAEVTGIARETIRRRLTLSARIKRARKRRLPPMAYDAATDRMVATQRCPRCGAMVIPPCLACQANRRKRAGGVA